MSSQGLQEQGPPQPHQGEHQGPSAETTGVYFRRSDRGSFPRGDIRTETRGVEGV